MSNLMRWLALPALLLLVALTTLLGYNMPQPITVEVDDELRQVKFGFHGLEQAGADQFRWTNGAARVCLDQIGQVPRSSLHLRILGEGAYALGNDQLALAVSGQPIVTVPVPGATRNYHVLLGEALAQQDNACIELNSRAVTTPSDPRPLGVPFVSLSLNPLAAEGLIRPALGQLALNLALAALGFATLRLLGLGGPWRSSLLVGALAVLVFGAVASDLLRPGLGLSRHTLLLVAGAGAALGAARLVRASRWADLPLLTRDLLGMAFWSLMLVGLTVLIQRLLGFSSVWPLKAGFFPAPFTPLILVPILVFVVWAGLVVRTLASTTARPRLGWSLVLVLVGAILLPPLLKGTIRGWDTLFATFTDNPFEYIADLPLVGDDPLGFVGNFIDLKEQLSLHGSTHPPGSQLLLWGVERTLGPGPVPASLVAIALSGLAVLAGLWLAWRLGGPRLGLLAGAIAAVMPGQLVFSTTSMDGIFNMLLALGAAAFLLALEPPMQRRDAVLAGVLIALGLFFTYAATQLFFFGVAVALVAVVRRWPISPRQGLARLWHAARPVLAQGLIAAGVIVVLYLGLYLTTGFNVVLGALRSTAINAEVMRDVTARPFLPPSLAYYTLFLGANLLAFGWYLGPWGLSASNAAGGRSLNERPLTGWSLLAAGLVALIGGMAVSGLFNREVERIWGFTYPLFTALIARHALQGSPHAQPWRAGMFLGLAFAHGLMIRLLLNTFW
ncbi:MAG: hypothetical protein AB4911_13220 [Oscillochloridaceae bacterium umkhey_bin13]